MSNYSVKKSKSINAKFKALLVQDGTRFVDSETGEVIDIARIVSQAVGDEAVDVTVTNKSEVDITPTEE